MARKPRVGSQSGYYHFITRGVNKKKIFHKQGDFEYYLKLLREYCGRFNILLFHYCVMSNHIHLVVKTEDLKSLGRFGHFTHRRYAYYYCKTHRWSEQVFRRNFLSIPIETDAYLLECGRYIERNPKDAKIVMDPADYPHSSYRFYALSDPNDLLTPSPLYQSMGNTASERMATYRFYVTHERQADQEVRTPF